MLAFIRYHIRLWLLNRAIRKHNRAVAQLKRDMERHLTLYSK